MGKSKSNPNVNSEVKYQQNQRQKSADYWDPKVNQSASYLPEDRSNYTSSLNDLSNLSGSFLGGVGNVDTSQMSGDAAAYRNFAQGNTDSGRFFKGLLNNGGYTASELGDIRTAGNRIIPSFFANLRNNMRTAQNATGGYSPGYSGSAAAMARDAAHQSQEAALDTELGISDRVRQGKLTGAEGLNSMFLGGMGGASNLDQAITQAQLQNMGLDLQSRSIGANLMNNVASGYGNLYSGDRDYNLQNEAMRLKAMGMSDDSIASLLGLNQSNTNNKRNSIMAGVGTAATVAIAL